MSTMTKRTQWFTPSVADGYTIPGLPSAGLGDDRVALLADPDAVATISDDWRRINTDRGVFEVRRADCGSGCRCAAEIRPLLSARAVRTGVVLPNGWTVVDAYSDTSQVRFGDDREQGIVLAMLPDQTYDRFATWSYYVDPGMGIVTTTGRYFPHVFPAAMDFARRAGRPMPVHVCWTDDSMCRDCGGE